MVRTASLATDEKHRGRLKEVCMARLFSTGLDFEFFFGTSAEVIKND